jgi:hypothetical protein
VTAIYIEVSYCSLLEREESTVSSILQIGYDRVSFLFFNQLKSSTQLLLSLLLLYGTQSIKIAFWWSISSIYPVLFGKWQLGILPQRIADAGK